MCIFFVSHTDIYERILSSISSLVIQKKKKKKKTRSLVIAAFLLFPLTVVLTKTVDSS